MEVSAVPRGFSVGAAPLVPAIFVCTPTHTSHLSPEQNLHVCGPNPFYQCWSQCASDSLGWQTLFSKHRLLAYIKYQWTMQNRICSFLRCSFLQHKSPCWTKPYSWVIRLCYFQHMHQIWYLGFTWRCSWAWKNTLLKLISNWHHSNWNQLHATSLREVEKQNITNIYIYKWNKTKTHQRDRGPCLPWTPQCNECGRSFSCSCGWRQSLHIGQTLLWRSPQLHSLEAHQQTQSCILEASLS